MKTFLTIAAFAVTTASYAGTLFYTGTLTANSPTFDNPGGSGTGSGIHHYSVQQFTVSASGSYIFESASNNTSGTGTTGPSNALDTFLRLYVGAFNPATPATPAAIASNDDTTATWTVINTGPHAAFVGTAGTGFTGLHPGSRMTATLTAGLQYFLVNTSFRETNYVTTGDQGQPRGTFYTGISGPGNITAVPEPATMAGLGLGALALIRRRRAAKK